MEFSLPRTQKPSSSPLGRFSLCVGEGGQIRQKMDHLVNGLLQPPLFQQQLSSPLQQLVGWSDESDEETRGGRQWGRRRGYDIRSKLKSLMPKGARTTQPPSLRRLPRCIDCRHSHKGGSRS